MTKLNFSRLCLTSLLVLSMGSGLTASNLFVHAQDETQSNPGGTTSSSLITDYQTLKQAIEDPNRQTEIIVPGGTYEMDGTITVSKDLVLKNQPGEIVVFQLLNQTETVPTNQPSDFDTFFDVTQGTMTLDGETDQSLIFNGLLQDGELHDLSSVIVGNNTMRGQNVWRFEKGAFATVESGATLVGNAFTMKNLYIAGARNGAVYIKPGGTFVMNGGRIHNNQWVWSQSSYHTEPNFVNAYNGRFPVTGGVGNYAGTFTMNGGSIDHNYSAFSASGAAYVGAGISNNARAKLEVNGGSMSNNTAATHEGMTTAGGAISSIWFSDVTINNGSFNNNLASAGGVISSGWLTTTTINGGSFQYNKAITGGGVIASVDNFIGRKEEGEQNPMLTDISVDGSNDNVYTIYAADPNINFDINKYYQLTYGAYTTINGGEFVNNEANYGGAIYLAANGEINAGEFKQNKADTYGGAVYLSTQPYTLTVRNAYFTNNKASDDAVTSMNLPDHLPASFHTGSGGAIWYCPTGEGIFNVSNGAAVYRNTATTEGDDFTKMKTGNENYKVTVSNRMLGGGYIAWYDDKQNARTSDATAENTELHDVNDDLMLHAVTSERAFAAARSLATTIFEGNESKRGGAIGTNGIVNFGDSDQEFDLRVTAEFDPSVSNKKPLNAQVYVVDGENKLLVDEVVLNQDNNFEKLLTGLPLQARKAVLDYFVVLSNEDFEATYQVSLNDAPLQDGNEFNTRDLLNDDMAHVHMIVKEKPKTSTPIEIKTPETPVKAEVIVPKTGINETISGYIVICLLLIGMIVLEIHHYKKS